jgi:RNase P/RNase MRP subunit POP5
LIKKEKQRYILFKIITESDTGLIILSKKEFLDILWNVIWNYFGMNTANKIGLWLLELDWEKKYGIIRCSHNTKEIMISALSLIKKINNSTLI